MTFRRKLHIMMVASIVFLFLAVAAFGGTSDRLDALKKDLEQHPEVYEMFRMLDMHPHWKDGIIIVPPWVKDGKRTPEMYFNFSPGKKTWEPLMRRI